MNLRKMLLVVFLGLSIIQSQTILCATKNDSLVDIFPLAIGNQWEYNYYYDSFSEITTYFDSGSVIIKILDNTVTTDSTLWMLEEGIKLVSWGLSFNKPNIDTVASKKDTIKLVELHQGRHRLYKVDDNKIFYNTSIFPFYLNLDSNIYRYDTVNSDGIKYLDIRNYLGIGMYSLMFKKDKGIVYSNFNDGCTCMDGYSGIHALISSLIASVEYHSHGRSAGFLLHQNFPNPFNPSTTMSFELSKKSFVTLKVYDVMGHEIATLVNGALPAGTHSAVWNASMNASGVYFYTLQTDSYSETKKLILLK